MRIRDHVVLGGRLAIIGSDLDITARAISICNISSYVDFDVEDAQHRLFKTIFHAPCVIFMLIACKIFVAT